jgi:iron complex outermembrane recepter protein
MSCGDSLYERSHSEKRGIVMSRSQRLKDCVRLALIAAGAAATLPTIAAASDAEESADKIAVIIVTAQKREESLQEVPVAITAFTNQQRDQLGITSVVDMANFTPGFVYNTGQDRVSIRGIGRYTNQLGADSSVGVYEDGVFETFTVKAGNSSLYTDRIEVLRGPQGTLYGRASIGGAVNIISRRPTKDWYSEVRVSYDNYNNHVEEGAISGPITDTLQFRLAATKYDQTDGYFKNVGKGPDSGNVRDEWVYEGQLQWQATDKDEFWLKVFGGEWNNGGGNAGGRTTNQVLVGLDGKTPTPAGTYFANAVPTSPIVLSLTTNALVPSLGAGYLTPAHTTLNSTGVNPGNDNIRDFYSNYPQTVDLSDYYGGVLQYNHDFDTFTVKYIGGLQHYDYVENVEWGEGFILATGLDSYQLPGQVVTYPDSLLFYEEKQTINSNEVNFISTGDGPLQWVAGIYNFNQHFTQPESVYRPGQTELAAPVNGPANPHQDNFFGEGVGGSRAWAGYGQIDWNFTDTWKATFGARYEKDWKWGDDSGSLFLFVPTAGYSLNLTNIPGVLPAIGKAYPGASAAVYNAATGRAERRLEGDWSGVTGTAGLQWTPDDKTNVYLKYSRGFKSGGFNIGSGPVVPNPQTDPEHSNDYQLGYKTVFANVLQLNVDAFYDQYYDAQIPIGTPQASGVVATSFFNMPEASSSGVEVEMMWQATSALQLIFNYGYNKTKIIESGCVVDAAGDPGATLIGAQPRNCTQGSQNLEGNSLPNAPENKLAFNTNYTFTFGNASSLMLSGSYIWRDKQYGSVFNRPYTEAPSWDQADFRITYKNGSHLTLIAYAKNAFDSVGYSSGALGVTQNNAAAAPAGFVKNYPLNPPRVVGGELQYKF